MVFAGVQNHAQSITVAVEGYSDISAGLTHFFDQLLQIFRFSGVWMMCRKIAVDLTIQRCDLTTQLSNQRRATAPAAPFPASSTTFSGAATAISPTMVSI